VRFARAGYTVVLVGHHDHDGSSARLVKRLTRFK
jgi:hypothetical protein